MRLHLDLETYSQASIMKTGVYRYAADESFEILLLAYAWDDEPVQLVDLARGENIPADVVDALTDPLVRKLAFNAQFERVCLSAHLDVYLSPVGWECTKILASAAGLPGSLEGVSEALKLTQGKLDTGKDLIKYFCAPCKPTKVNGGRTRNRPEHAVDKWESFCQYNVRDVEAEREIHQRLTAENTTVEWTDYWIDQTINDRGVLLDRKLVDNAISMSEAAAIKARNTLHALTELANPNSPKQLLTWLHDRFVDIGSLSKDAVATALEALDPDSTEARVLRIRQSSAKTSVKKYEAMAACMLDNDRAHGFLQFMGAGRTGRWAGRLVQVQNLPRNTSDKLDQARKLVKAGDYEGLAAAFDSVPDILSQLVRTAFIPREGCRFVVTDYSAIEARVLAWLAGEDWRLDAFRQGADLYCASASAMFGVPVEKHGVNSELRQKGKIAELACGYGGSVGALKAMGALNMGLAESELQPIVNQWRSASPRIVAYWWEIDEAAKAALKGGTGTVGAVTFTYRDGNLICTLPSGRELVYRNPRLEIGGKFDKQTICFDGVQLSTKWGKVDTYGPKLVENIVQATSRDLLAHALSQLSHEHLDVVMHVHDEVIVEAPHEVSVERVVEAMTRLPTWAAGLPLDADGYECDYYMKD